MFAGPFEQLGGLELLRKLQPHEVAALGLAPARAAAEPLLERFEHRVAPLPQQPTDPLETWLKQPAPKELVDGRLGDQRRRDVGRGCERLELCCELPRDECVADSQPGRDRLRERRGVEHLLTAFELEHRRKSPALEADEPVRVVLQHRQRLCVRELGQPSPALLRERHSCRVLERRDRVEESRSFAFRTDLLERFYRR